MDDGKPASNPLGDFAVERVTKDDGRYLLYYTWPEPSPRGANRAPDVAEADGAAPEAWTPESGPVEGTSDRARTSSSDDV